MGLDKNSTRINRLHITVTASDIDIKNVWLYGVDKTGTAIEAADITGNRRRTNIDNCLISFYDIGIKQEDHGSFLSIKDCLIVFNETFGVYLNSNDPNTGAHGGRGDIYITNCYIHGSKNTGLRLRSTGTLTVSNAKIQNNGENVVMYIEDPANDRIRQIYFDSCSIEDASSYVEDDIVSIVQKSGNTLTVTMSTPNQVILGYGCRVKLIGTIYDDTYEALNVDNASGTFDIVVNSFIGNTGAVGSARRSGWDMRIDANGSPSRIDDVFVTNGDLNFLYLNEGIGFRASTCTIKDLKYIGPNFTNAVFIDEGNVASAEVYGRVPISGYQSNPGTYSSNSDNRAGVYRSDYFITDRITLGDDIAYSFTPRNQYGLIMLMVENQNQNRFFFSTYDVGLTPILYQMIITGTGSATSVETGALTDGTSDGTDGRLNVSAFDGKIFIKNRLGAENTIRVVMF